MSNRVELSAVLGCGVRITEEGMPNVWVESKIIDGHGRTGQVKI